MRSLLKIHTSWTVAASAPLSRTRYWADFFFCHAQNVSFSTLPLVLCSGFGFSAQDRVQCAWCGGSGGTNAHQIHHRTGGLPSTAGQGEATLPPSGHGNHTHAILTEQMWFLVCRKSFSRTTCTQTHQFFGNQRWQLLPGCLESTANTKRWA